MGRQTHGAVEDPFSLSGWSGADETGLADMITAAQRNYILGTPGDDQIKGTSGDDKFWVKEGGDDTLRGLGGNDVFDFGISLTAEDRVDGGAGRDVVVFGWNDRLELNPEALKGIETLRVSGGNIVLDNGFGNLDVQHNAGGPISVDGSAVSTGRLRLYGRTSDDTLVGGHRGDRIEGGGNSDSLTGGDGHDTFVYDSKYDSRSGNADNITDFSRADRISMFVNSTVSSYHIGATPGHVGDVLVSFDEDSAMTIVQVFTDADDQADMEIDLSGSHLNLTVNHSTDIVVG